MNDELLRRIVVRRDSLRPPVLPTSADITPLNYHSPSADVEAWLRTKGFTQQWVIPVRGNSSSDINLNSGQGQLVERLSYATSYSENPPGISRDYQRAKEPKDQDWTGQPARAWRSVMSSMWTLDISMALIFTCFFFLFLLQDGPETVRPKWSTALRPAKGGAPRGGSRGRSKSLQPDYGAEGASRGLSCFLCVCVCVCGVIRRLFVQPWLMHRLGSF